VNFSWRFFARVWCSWKSLKSLVAMECSPQKRGRIKSWSLLEIKEGDICASEFVRIVMIVLCKIGWWVINAVIFEELSAVVDWLRRMDRKEFA